MKGLFRTLGVSVCFALVFATLVGLVSGIYPALRAASMKPLRALRTD